VERVVALGSDHDLKSLESGLEAIRISAEAGDTRSTARQDIAFHGTIFDLAQHNLLRRSWADTIEAKLKILLNTTIRTHLALEEPVKKHEIIVKAIQARDIDRARMEVAIHVEDAKARALRALTRAR
jgi:DNA-binding GntR family transcriptional regulator